MGAGSTQSPYLTYEQAAAFCSVDRTTIWRATKTGRLRAAGPGAAVRFHVDELRRWMDSRGGVSKERK